MCSPSGLEGNPATEVLADPISGGRELLLRKGQGVAMRRFGFYLVAIAMTVCVVAVISSASAQSAGLVFVTKIPAGYRDWKLISVAHEEANLNSFGAVLGNDVAIQAYRDGTLPFPDGAIIAALHYRFVPSEENNKAFGQTQSFVAGDPTNVQFMVKASKKYASAACSGYE